MLLIHRLLEYYIVLRPEQAHEVDQKNGMSAALGVKSSADARHIFTSAIISEVVGVHVRRTKEHCAKYLPRLYMLGHFILELHWGGLLAA